MDGWRVAVFWLVAATGSRWTSNGDWMWGVWCGDGVVWCGHVIVAGYDCTFSSVPVLQWCQAGFQRQLPAGVCLGFVVNLDNITRAVVRWYDLDASHCTRLFRRMAAIQYTRTAMRHEVRELLPIGSMDGNDALVAVQRLTDWLEGKNTTVVQPFQ